MMKQPQARMLMRYIACVLVLLLFSTTAFAENESVLNEEDIKAKYVCLIDATTGLTLYEKNATERAYPASTTKIMTGLLVLENMTREELQEPITVGEEVRKFSSANSLLGNKENEVLRGIDLLYSMMLLSANDSAATLAIHIGGSIDGFATMMNAKAKELGMDSTNFVNPHGIHDENHYTTTLDMTKLAIYALKNERFMGVVGTGSYVCPPTNKRKIEKEVFNSNRFLTDNPKTSKYNWKPVIGMKTGSTKAAGGCLVTAAKQDGKSLICVLFGDETKNDEGRWPQSKALLEYGFANLNFLTLGSLKLDNIDVQIPNVSKTDETEGLLNIPIDTTDQTVALLKKDIDAITADPTLIEVVSSLNPNLTAPISQGDKLGTAAIKYGQNTLAVIDLLAPRTVASVETDPSNPISNLIKGVSSPQKKNYTWIYILVALLLLLVCALAVILLRSNKRMQRAKRRNSALGYAGGHAQRRNSYYDYRRK